MADKTLTCRDCGGTFTFTEGEQDFYAQKGYSDPVRCPDCRARKKADRSAGAGGGYSESYSSRGSYDSGYSSGGYAGRSERVRTQVVCANCGKETEVPFVPRQDRPVYCSDCFSQMNAGAGSRGGRNRY